jgi:hypothetical protein
MNSDQRKKIDSVVLLIWFHQRNTNSNAISISDINRSLIAAHLPKYNTSRLGRDLKSDKRITKGDKGVGYKLNRTELDSLNNRFGYLFETELEIKERISLNSVPFLTTEDISNAQLMAQIYLLIHCFENSVRRFIIEILNSNYGENWWDSIKNTSLEKKVQDRSGKEIAQKWISQRGENNSPLFYLDWSDLLKIIRKEETLFLPKIADLKFVELRFEELERVRNIIAHNGFIPDQNDIDRLVLYFQDWIKQLSTK